LLVLLRLGLRAAEAAGLTLDDIDWRTGQIVVHGKAHRQDRLPLPSEVGEAIAAYLQRGRARSAHREVFLRTVAPIGPLDRGGVSSLVRRACHRPGSPRWERIGFGTPWPAT
jgi:Site-specific recombinase XerD